MIKNFLSTVNISEGGASGHLSHVHDELDMTFGELMDLIRQMSEGKIKGQEKVDGQNIWITYKNGEIRAARNQGDLKTDGMFLKDMINKFAGRGQVKQAFVRGMIAFIRLIKSSKVIQDAFNVGDDTLWINAEIMYSNNPNTIYYDGNNIALHDAKVFSKKSGSAVETKDGNLRFNKINSEAKNKKIKGWNVVGDRSISLKTFDPKPVINKLLTFMHQYKLNDSNNLKDYLRSAVNASSYVSAFADNEAVVDYLVKKMSGETVPNVNTLKKSVSPKQSKELSSLNSSIFNIKKEVLSPIENLIHEVAVMALSGVHSTLIKNPTDEMERLKSEASKLLSSGIDESKSQKIMAQMSKILGRNIKSINQKNINAIVKTLDSAIEGVVFQHNDRLLKITGNFAPLNQILGVIKYGN